MRQEPGKKCILKRVAHVSMCDQPQEFNAVVEAFPRESGESVWKSNTPLFVLHWWNCLPVTVHHALT